MNGEMVTNVQAGTEIKEQKMMEGTLWRCLHIEKKTEHEDTNMTCDTYVLNKMINLYMLYALMMHQIRGHVDITTIITVNKSCLSKYRVKLKK